MSRPLIFERFPEAALRLPWMPLASGAPTPIEPLPSITLRPNATIRVEPIPRANVVNAR